MSEKRQYVVVFPDGSEFFVEEDAGRLLTGSYGRLFDRAAEAKNLRAPKGGPSYIRLVLFRLGIKDGQLTRTHVDQVDWQLPRAPMDADDYAQELKCVLLGIPKEFREFVSSQAYERGHSAGYDECFGIAKGLIADLQKPIEDYTNRIACDCDPPE